MMDRKSAFRRVILPLLPIIVVIAACDEDGPGDPTGPDLTGEEVEGLYQPMTFTFDIQASLPEKNVLSALVSSGIQPELSVDTEGGFQILIRDPATGTVELITGTYSLLDVGIELIFDDPADADHLLLPSEIELVFDAGAGTLSFQGQASLPSDRLKQLFPELQDEPLAEQVPGTLVLRLMRMPT